MAPHSNPQLAKIYRTAAISGDLALSFSSSRSHLCGYRPDFAILLEIALSECTSYNHTGFLVCRRN